MHLILAPTFRAESRSSWEIRVCLEPEVKSPPYSLVHSHTFFVSLLCSWMHERLACFWKHSQKSIESLKFFFFLSFFPSVLFDFLIIYCPWSKPPKLDSCTPIILPSCKVTAQQSTLCFPFSVDQITTYIVDLPYGVGEEPHEPVTRAPWLSQWTVKIETKCSISNLHCCHGRLPLLRG